MNCDCRRPINCYNDGTRYKTMIVFHTIDLIFFIIRLSLVSNDISKNVSDTKSFLIPIILFDLIASVPIIICNIIYVIMHHCVKPLVHGQSSLQWLWRFGTMTCIRLNCHDERPQTILLMRVIVIVGSFILRFICFIIGASCSARFKSQCTAYTVIAAFALVSSILLITTEFIHFFRLWTYNPTDTRNIKNRNAISSTGLTKRIEKTHRRHLGFIHHSLLNDQNADKFRDSRCEKGINCKSYSLYHHLLYHTLESEHDIDLGTLPVDERKSFIAFYRTNKQEALAIAQNGFPYGDNTDTKFKDYLHLKQSIFFTRSCKGGGSSSAEAIICVRLNLGRIETINNDENPNLNNYFGFGDGKCDTVYVKKTRQFYLRMPGQIEKWIVAINAGVPVNDNLDGELYVGCP
ncbi:unnamed protein product [Rotaria sp. Silwood2]|nr:unnamed protein product [Rotaria sp. Silwood2]CAF2953200.1 unnamed protein product [Rotaria sp. Silwood2]CAF3914968.1 unnamed protein product [Rotaria sp. Silwood2]CAF4235522.1 unnamed protein product [Rotaria sp. Silwood2]